MLIYSFGRKNKVCSSGDCLILSNRQPTVSITFSFVDETNIQWRVRACLSVRLPQASSQKRLTEQYWRFRNLVFSQQCFWSFKSSGARYSVPLNVIYPATQHKIPQYLNIHNKFSYWITNTKYSRKNLYLIVLDDILPLFSKCRYIFSKSHTT